jgi:ABC-2 type transport system ATP-binding protein
MLTVQHLRKEFTSVLAVDDVSFEVPAGSIFGLLGPNGAGKTTTIRMILHILEADGGSVLYDGKGFTDLTRDMLGYLPEERGLYKKSRLIDILLYLGELRGMQRGKARTEAMRWLARLDLRDAAPRKLEELSKGNQQKVQFVGAVMHDPAIVVMDEPFSGLDPVNQDLFKDILLEMKQRGKAIIFSTHQMDQAERLSDALCLINKGRVVLSGTVRDVKKRYGRNSLHVDFDGDSALLNSISGVQNVVLYEHSAEMQLMPGVTPREIIAQINPHLDLRKVELLEPSLHSIFLQTVGGNAVPAPEKEGGA